MTCPMRRAYSCLTSWLQPPRGLGLAASAIRRARRPTRLHPAPVCLKAPTSGNLIRPLQVCCGQLLLGAAGVWQHVLLCSGSVGIWLEPYSSFEVPLRSHPVFPWPQHHEILLYLHCSHPVFARLGSSSVGQDAAGPLQLLVALVLLRVYGSITVSLSASGQHSTALLSACARYVGWRAAYLLEVWVEPAVRGATELIPPQGRVLQRRLVYTRKLPTWQTWDMVSRFSARGEASETHRHAPSRSNASVLLAGGHLWAVRPRYHGAGGCSVQSR